jgi:hypothetical protein
MILILSEGAPGLIYALVPGLLAGCSQRMKTVVGSPGRRRNWLGGDLARLEGDHQLVGDLGIAQSSCQQDHHLALVAAVG